MKRLLPLVAVAAAVAAALPAHAQYRDDLDAARYDAAIRVLEDQLDALRDDPDVREYAQDELERADDYIDELATTDPEEVDVEDFVEAERLIEVTRDAATDAIADQQFEQRRTLAEERRLEREEAELAQDEAERAERDARLAADDAESARERELAAKLEAEHEKNRNARLRAELADLKARETDRGLVVTLGDVLFETGKSDLKPGARRSLDELVAAMKTEPGATVIVEGHTDSTGTLATNMTLSQRRANTVRSYLTMRGIAPDRVLAQGLGPDYPVADNATSAGRQQNRRVELVVKNGAMEPRSRVARDEAYEDE